MAEHKLVKPEKIVNYGLGVLEAELILPHMFHKHPINDYKGTKDDTINVKVAGVLPYHDYEWRAGRNGGNRPDLELDEYKERSVPTSFGGNAYSAVPLTDEQAFMDLGGSWASLVGPQFQAVARGLNRGAVSTVVNAPYEVSVGVNNGNWRAAVLEARRVLNLFHVPGQRYLVVGSNVEMDMLSDPKFTLAQYVGGERAAATLTTAILGVVHGFVVISDVTIPPDDAYALTSDGFIFLNAAPHVPASVTGAVSSHEGVAMRWVRAYVPLKQTELSIVNTYYGFKTVSDVLIGWDEDNKTEVVSESEYFVRGVKLQLGGTNSYPEEGSELATLTGVSETNEFSDPDQGVTP